MPTLDEWRRVLDVNLLATLYTCTAAISPMREQGGGDIINISSTAGRRAAAPFGPYSTSKFGLTGMTEGLRQEVGKYGIRVCIIEPGATTTEVADSITDPELSQAPCRRMFQGRRDETGRCRGRHRVRRARCRAEPTYRNY